LLTDDTGKIIPEVKFIKDTQESNRLSSNEVEIEAVSKNMKHYTKTFVYI